MKKILSILCAVAILMSMSVMIFAAELPEIDPEVAAKAEEVAGKIAKDFEELLEKAGTKTADQFVDEIIDMIAQKTGYLLDVAEIKALLAEQGIDLENIKVLTASQMDDFTQAIFDKIGEDYGTEAVDAVYDTLKNSDLVNWFANLYVQTPEETTEPETETTTEPETETTTTIPDTIPDTIPATGEGSVIGVVAVLAVAAAAAVVCTKKAKED